MMSSGAGSPSSTKPNKHLFPWSSTTSVMAADASVTMSVEGNYILNVLSLYSLPGGENPSVGLRERMEESCFFDPPNAAMGSSRVPFLWKKDAATRSSETQETGFLLHVLIHYRTDFEKCKANV